MAWRLLLFYDSEFYRYKGTLDSAIASRETNAKLLIDPLSPRCEDMKNSSLTHHRGHAVVDPCELELQGKVFLADSDGDRSNKDAVAQYAGEKTNRKTLSSYR